MLYQAIGTSTCALAAVSNLIDLYGRPAGRAVVRDLLGDWRVIAETGVSHSMLLKANSNLFLRSHLRWVAMPRFSFVHVRRVLEPIFEDGAPAVLTFHI